MLGLVVPKPAILGISNTPDVVTMRGVYGNVDDDAGSVRRFDFDRVAWFEGVHCMITSLVSLPGR
jgi:hypothetical protein